MPVTVAVVFVPCEAVYRLPSPGTVDTHSQYWDAAVPAVHVNVTLDEISREPGTGEIICASGPGVELGAGVDVAVGVRVLVAVAPAVEVDDGGAHSRIFLPVSNVTMRAQIPPSARLTWTVDAESHVAAMTAMHEHLGWEPYVPMVMGEEA